MLRRSRWTGTAGAWILAAAALVTGALPVAGSADAWPGATLPQPVGTAAAYFGLTLLVGGWLGLGTAVRAGTVGTGQLHRILVGWALPLAVVPPLYSRDVYSYLAQGAMYHDGVDPYRFGPAAYGGPLAAQVSPFWEHSTAPYGPVFLVLAALAFVLGGGSVVAGVLGMRLLMLAALAGTVLVLPRLARRYGVDPARALWLGALNPLVLAHVVSGAHNDALLVLLLLVAVLLAARDRPLLAAAVIAVAVLVKASAVVAFLVVVPAAGRRLGGRRPLPAGAAAVGLVGTLTAVAITSVMDAWYGWVGALQDTARVRNGLSLSTDLGVLLARLCAGGTRCGAVDPVSVTRALGLVLAGLLVLLLIARNRGRPLYGLGLALVVVVLLGPVVHPWYLLWGLVPLAASASDPRVVRGLTWAAVALAYYPVPSGGGPTADLAAGVAAAALGVVVCRSLLGRGRWPGVRPADGGNPVDAARARVDAGRARVDAGRARAAHVLPAAAGERPGDLRPNG